MIGVCVSDCSVRGQHVPECLGDECWGCLPRSAEQGALCRFCFQQLVAAVVDVPGLHAHLVALAAPSVSSPMSSDGGGGGVAGSRVLYPQTLMAADELASLLGSWADEIVRLHPGGVVPPSDLGWRWSAPVRAVDPETGDAFIPSASRLGADQSAVEALVRWILPHMAWVSRQSWVADMRAELCREVSTVKARWPQEERSHRVPMPCPECAQKTLVYTPPSDYQVSAMVVCESLGCGKMWLDDAWTRVVSLVLAHPELASEVA